MTEPRSIIADGGRSFLSAYPPRRRGLGRVLGERAGYVLFFLVLFVPTAYQPVKAALLLLLCAAVAYDALGRDNLALHPSVGMWTLFSITVSVFFMVRGLVNGAPGAARVGTVYAVWPAVYTLLVAGAADRRTLRGLVRTATWGTLGIAVYALAFVLYTIGWLHPALYVELDQGQGIGIYSGYVELNLYSLSSLLFLVPFALAAVLTWPLDGRLAVSRRLLWLALVSGTAVVVLSGRRALLLIVALAPFFTLALRLALPAGLRRASRSVLIRSICMAAAGIVALLLYLQTLGITPLGMLEMFLEGFDFGADLSASLRRRQLWALLAGWAQSPLLGAGHGAGAPALVRDFGMPWAYELSYVALLFHVGIVGVAAYAAGVVWIVWTGVRVLREGGELSLYLLPVLVGMLCFLVGNATNPYLQKFDFIWVIFFPVCYVNRWLLDRASRPIA